MWILTIFSFFPVQAFQRLIYVSTLVFGDASTFLLPWKRVFKVTDAQVLMTIIFMNFFDPIFLYSSNQLFQLVYFWHHECSPVSSTFENLMISSYFFQPDNKSIYSIYASRLRLLSVIMPSNCMLPS